VGNSITKKTAEEKTDDKENTVAHEKTGKEKSAATKKAGKATKGKEKVEAPEEEGRVTGIYTNYDAVFKDAMWLFIDKALDFFHVKGNLTIKEPLRTETVEVSVNIDILDMSFRLSDGMGFHVEEEVDLSKEDLVRFGIYHLQLIQTYKCDFTTVIFVKNPTNYSGLKLQMLNFSPIIINCSEINADEILERLKKQVKNGEAINELEAIYLPLFKSNRYTSEELLKEVVSITKQTAMQEQQKLKLIALAIVVSNKVVDKKALESIWEEVRLMGLKLLEIAEEKGEEKGIAKGEAIGIAKGIAKGEAIGIAKSATVLKMFKNGIPLEQISSELSIPMETVNDFVAVLNS